MKSHVAMCSDGSTLHLVVPLHPDSEEDKEFIDREADDASEEEQPATTLANWRLHRGLRPDCDRHASLRH